MIEIILWVCVGLLVSLGIGVSIWSIRDTNKKYKLDEFRKKFLSECLDFNSVESKYLSTCRTLDDVKSIAELVGYNNNPDNIEKFGGDIKIIDIPGNDNQEPTHHTINWLYPEMYDNKKSTLTIGMENTRGADEIRVSYNSKRDGWVIEQASIFEWSIEDNTHDPDWQEVAFIRAWARENK